MAKKKRVKERTFGAAIRLGALITFVVLIAGFLILLSDHASAVYWVYRIRTNGIVQSRSSALYQHMQAILAVDDLILTSLSFFAGGITIGAIAPSRTTLKNALIGCAEMSGVLLLAAFVFLWGLLIYYQGGVNPGQFPPSLAIAQFIAFAIEMGVCVLGGAAGYGLRALRGPRAAAAQS